MKEGIVDFLRSHHTKAIVEYQSIHSVLQIEMSFVGTAHRVGHLLHLQHLPALHSLLVFIYTHLLQLLNFEYAKSNVVGSNVELPTQ